MDVAFGIVRLFPEGGLQRDCIRLARLLIERGHRVTIYASRNLCDLSDDLPVVVLPIRAATNHGGDWAFARKFRAAVAGRFDRVVGFNKLIGLDMMYCADPPVAERQRGWWTRILPRHRARLRLEGECFGPDSSTHIVALTHPLAEAYRQYWGIGADRFTVIPPGLAPERCRPDLRSSGRRDALREALRLPADKPAWLWVGAKPHTKGLDRVLAALATTPSPILLVVGVTAGRGEGRAAAKHARRLGLKDRVRFLGHREDVADLMSAADVLVHPARLDVTGQVILEAIVNGLPVIASACCGFAEHVRAAQAGIVLPEPFSLPDLKAATARLQDRGLAETFSRNGVAYGRNGTRLDGLVVAADVIENGPRGGSSAAQPERSAEPVDSALRF